MVDKKFKMFCFYEFLFAEIDKDSIVELCGPARSLVISVMANMGFAIFH